MAAQFDRRADVDAESHSVEGAGPPYASVAYYLIEPGSLANLLLLVGLPWNDWSLRVQWAVQFAQNATLFVVVVYLGAIAWRCSGHKRTCACMVC